MPKISLQSSEGEVLTEYKLDRDQIDIGRNPAVDIVLQDRMVARRHATMRRGVDGQYWLIDNGSSGGVYVNGRAIKPKQLLKDGDEICIGESLLRFHNEAEQAPVVLPVETEKERARLLERLREDPDDEGRYLVFADWLQQQQDPRGELILVQHALARVEDQKLRAQEQALLAKHRPHFFGPLVGHGSSIQLGWRLGFIERLSHSGVHEGVERLLSELLAHDSGMLLGELELSTYWSSAAAYQRVFELLRARRPPLWRLSLNVLPRRIFGRSQKTGENPDLGALESLISALPRLRSLSVAAEGFTLDAKSLRGLQALELDAEHALPASVVRTVLRAELPLLKSLHIGLGSQAEFGTGAHLGSALAQFLGDDGPPSLEHLSMGCPWIDIEQLAEMLVSSPWALGLERLTLAGAALTQGAVDILQEGDFKGMRALKLRFNVPRWLRRKLLRLGPIVSFEPSPYPAEIG